MSMADFKLTMDISEIVAGRFEIGQKQFLVVDYASISSKAPVAESMMKPRTTMSLGMRGWVLMVSTVLRTEAGVS